MGLRSSNAFKPVTQMDMSDEVSEDELVPLSALQHMMYCPRQCALIHVERQWAENQFTAEGRNMHRRVDDGDTERRRGVHTHRSVPLRSLRLGVFGIADVVEMRDGGAPYPVEYKRGQPKAHRADEVQLCAQAICLESMLGVSVPEGALFYGRNRRRKKVLFDSTLRTLTERVANETRQILASGKTPPPVYAPRKCDACSLKSVCQPEEIHGPGAVDRWLAEAVER